MDNLGKDFFVFSPSESQTKNAIYIYKYFEGNNWSHNAICGMLGNFSWEGLLNPYQWQIGMPPNGPYTGYGLAQWTPIGELANEASMYGIINYKGLEGQCELIKQQSENNGGGQYLEKPGYELSMSSFAQSTDSIDYLTSVWTHNYERPQNYESVPDRCICSNYWNNYFANNGTGGTGNSGSSGSNSNSGASYGTVNITSGTLNVRSGPGMGYSIIGSLDPGAVVQLGTIGGEWDNIYFGEHGGWVYAEYITPNGSSSGSNSGASYGTVNITSGTLNVRSGPGMGYSIIGSLDPGAVVQLGTTSGEWDNIYFGEHGGWVYAEYIIVN
ncbi:phage tail tip lysozyme [uncultured Clostridium sp.]|uniref:phage tail tip lysozyme n=1 Tax=uncultured Clostridium sp. TaxID=59620 RepID=UPI00262CE1FA|nr:phage tail tip lysozyme [uncultured Clostridium sp.]